MAIEASDSLPPPRIDLLVHSPSSDPFLPIFQTLLEPSPPLKNLLVPQLHSALQAISPRSNLPKSYRDLIAIAQSLVESWDPEDQAVFLSAHPRIGETKNLSKLSGTEQSGTASPTPGEVLKRLSVCPCFFATPLPPFSHTSPPPPFFAPYTTWSLLLPLPLPLHCHHRRALSPSQLQKMCIHRA